MSSLTVEDIFLTAPSGYSVKTRAHTVTLDSGNFINLTATTATLTNIVTAGYNIGHTGTNVFFGQGTPTPSGTANSGFGYGSLSALTTGSSNICIGYNAGSTIVTNSSNIMIGHVGTVADSSTIRIGTAQTKALVAGIYGVTTVNNDAVVVMVDSAGQLGTISSSETKKENIRPLAEFMNASAVIDGLAPVAFNYIEQHDLPNNDEIGLIAEQVHEICPHLVIYKDGAPATVKYHLLSILLLAEVKRLAAIIDNM